MRDSTNISDGQRVMILTGKNNHDWQRSAPFVADLLSETHEFTVDLSKNPTEVLEDVERIQEYDLLFIDYNGPAWSNRAQENFEEVVRQGVGVTALHAANNAFPGWEAYERMLGLTWRDESGHGEYHEFEVTIETSNHPITDGMDKFRLWDELYHGMVNPYDTSYNVLATAYSDPETGGTGQDEPVALARRFGEGRVFHSILGHVWPGAPTENDASSMRTFKNDGFQRLLVRGCEWAATGEVMADNT
jgi:type 1 glutamine amidotransferase